MGIPSNCTPTPSRCRQLPKGEGKFGSYITPRAGELRAEGIASVLETVTANAEVWDAIRIPYLLAEFARAMAVRGGCSSPGWASFRERMIEREAEQRYGKLWEVLDAAGVLRRQ